MVLPGLYVYWIVTVLMMAGLYVVISRRNLIKQMVGLGIFQASVFILYIAMGKVEGGTAPIIVDAIIDRDRSISTNRLDRSISTNRLGDTPVEPTNL